MVGQQQGDNALWLPRKLKEDRRISRQRVKGLGCGMPTTVRQAALTRPIAMDIPEIKSQGRLVELTHLDFKAEASRFFW